MNEREYDKNDIFMIKSVIIIKREIKSIKKLSRDKTNKINNNFSTILKTNTLKKLNLDKYNKILLLKSFISIKEYCKEIKNSYLINAQAEGIKHSNRTF